MQLKTNDKIKIWLDRLDKAIADQLKPNYLMVAL